MTKDMVNHPPHYQSENGIECIDAILAALGPDQYKGYLRGTTIKYIWRVGKKDPAKTIEDAKKAQWFLSRYIAYLELEAGKNGSP